MCGEKQMADYAATEYGGSPPHVRGKASLPVLDTCLLGITPACAGKSKSCSMPVQAMQDHPRMCGEKGFGNQMDARRSGSPPHVRGKGLSFSFCISRYGITPACAGKRKFGIIIMDLSLDHPRMCGEKLLGRPVSSREEGSPPHVRGKVLYAFVRTLAGRITPACAGKS